MSIHRRAAKRDAVAKEIVATLRAHGCIVWDVSGTGLPDLTVLKNGRAWFADTKSKTGKATPAQEKKWEEAATKVRVAVFILRTPADAVAMLNSALPPWEPEHIARGKASAAAYGVAYDPALDERPARPKSGYTPPRQPPGDAKLAEVFAPPPQCECGHPESFHPSFFTDDQRPCALCRCKSLKAKP